MSARQNESFVRFPNDFLWGAACAAHQVSGSSNSNWSVWESSDKRMDELTRQGVSSSRLREFMSLDACEFDTHYKSDMRLAKTYGHRAIRFSIDWAAVEPEPGAYNFTAIERYGEMCNAARALALEPIITFYHWTHRNGFEWYQDDAAERFAKFVALTLPHLGQIRYFTVLNEPNVYLTFSYRWGEWPPCIHESNDPSAYAKAHAQQVMAHKRAYKIIKRHLPNAQVGIGQSFGWNTSDDPKLKAEKDRWQYEFLDEIEDYLDFIGIQIYMHSHWHRDESKNVCGWEGKDPCTEHPVTSDMIGAKQESWGMCPQSVYRVVVESWQRYGKKIMITEHGHGVPELVDHRRCWYLWESIGWLENAIASNIPLIGYLHWSIMDNFEWKFGWGPKFGLFHVERATQRRTPRSSAHLYRDIINENGRTNAIAETYRDVILLPHTHTT